MAKKKQKASSLNLILNAAVAVVILVGLFFPMFKKELEAIGIVYATITMGFFSFTSSVEIFSGSTTVEALQVSTSLFLPVLIGVGGAVFALLPNLLNGKFKGFSAFVGAGACLAAIILFIAIPMSSDYSFLDEYITVATGWLLIMGAFIGGLVYNGLNVFVQLKK